MGKSKIREAFLFHIEHFYRNFGNEWSVDDFPGVLTKHRDLLISLLPELQELGILKIKEDGESFVIIKLPSEVVKS